MSCHTAVAREDTPLVLMDRVYGVNGSLITIASIEAISYRVFEYATQEDAQADVEGEEIGEAADLTPSAVIFDTLQTAAPWVADEDAEVDGYNFRFTLPAACRPTGGTWHRVEILLTPSSSDEAFPLVWLVKTTPLASS